MTERIIWALAGIAASVLAGAALYALHTADDHVEPIPRVAASIVQPEPDTSWCLRWERNEESPSEDIETIDLRHAAEAKNAAADGHARGILDIAEASVMYHEAVAEIDRICEGILR